MPVDIDFVLIVMLVLSLIGMIVTIFMREMLSVHIKYLNMLDDNHYGTYIIQFLHSQDISVCKCIGDSYFTHNNIVSAIYSKFNLAVVITDNWERDSSMILHHMVNRLMNKFLSESLIIDSEVERFDRNFLAITKTTLILLEHQSDSNSGAFNTFDLNGILMLCYMIKDCKYETSKIWYIFCIWRFIMNHKIVKDVSISYSDFARFVLYLNQKLMDIEIINHQIYTVDLNGEMDEDACVNLAFNAISA
jgi:hypothetical protein